MNHRGVADIGLLETHGNTAEVLEFTEEILHQVPPLVHLRVVLDHLDAIRPGRNHHHNATGLQLSAQLVAVVGFVRYQRLEFDADEQRWSADQVVTLGRRSQIDQLGGPSVRQFCR